MSKQIKKENSLQCLWKFFAKFKVIDAFCMKFDLLGWKTCFWTLSKISAEIKKLVMFMQHNLWIWCVKETKIKKYKITFKPGDLFICDSF